MFEKKKKGSKMQKTLNLPKYKLNFSQSNIYLTSANLKIDNLCEATCNLEMRASPSPQTSGTINVLISSFDSKISAKYSKYTQRYLVYTFYFLFNLILIWRIKRIFDQIIVQSDYERSVFLVQIEVIRDHAYLDSFHHLINLISACLLSANINLKYSVFAYTCFLNDSNDFKYETDFLKDNMEDQIENMNNVFVCKKYKDNNSLVSFQVVGEVKNGDGLMNAISFCMAAAEGIGKQIINSFFD
jgi:hypothetical protein